LAYVTDEVVIVDRQRGLITPYPKPIALEPPSWAVLPELVAPAATEHEWLVAPQSIGAGRVAHDPAPPVLVVLPSYQPGASSRCEPISRADAALALCRESFNFHDLAPGRLDVVAGVVRGAQCFTLAYGDAHAAARNVVAELAKSAS
jgi:hypothetical protein